MASITQIGASGIDISTLVPQLITSEFGPAQAALTKKLDQTNTQISDAGKLKSSLSTLQSAFQNLSDSKNIYALKFNVSDSSLFSATATTQASSKGSYQVEVLKLAQQQSLATSYVADVNHVGSGSFTIDLGKYSSDNSSFASSKSTVVTIAPGSDSLVSMRNAINSSNAGVTASIVKDGTGSRLTLTSNSSGADFAMRITTSDPALSSMKYDLTDTGSPDGLTQTVNAQDSEVKINGLLLTQSTNQVKDAISGVNLSLTKAAPGTVATLGIAENTDQVSSLVSDFVKKYNDAITQLKNLTSYNPSTKTSGSFSGDTSLRTLKTKLTQLVTGTQAPANTNIRALADIGVTTNKTSGLLEINQKKLSDALANNYSEIGNLFAKNATSTDSNIQVSGVTTNTKAGTYAVNLTEFTAGTSVAGTIGGLTGTSSGAILNGSGILLGLSLNVMGGSTGNRGQITVNDGIGSLASDFLNTYIQSSGSIDQSVTRLNQKVKSISKDQDNLNLRQDATQSRYEKQFQALDAITSQMQSTSSALTNALKGLLYK